MARGIGFPFPEPSTPASPPEYNRGVSYDSSKGQHNNPNPYVEEINTLQKDTGLGAPQTPLPPPYPRQVSYDYAKKQQYNPNADVVDNKTKRESTTSSPTDVGSLKVEKDEEGKEKYRKGKRQLSALIILRDCRIYIRAFAVLVMIVSLSLILTAVVSFAKAQKKAGNPLNNIPKPAPITDHPCIIFSGVAVMNLILSVSLFCFSCVSTKFRRSNEALNAVFTIISAIGFASSMGACFFLNKETTLQNDLWKWSCANHKNGIVSDALDFNLICNVVSYGWKFGLVQASLELLTFIISMAAFMMLKYSYFARYGVFGKVF